MRRGGPSFEQVASFGPLCRAAREAARGLKHRGAVAAFLADLEPEVLGLDFTAHGYGSPHGHSQRDPPGYATGSHQSAA